MRKPDEKPEHPALKGLRGPERERAASALHRRFETIVARLAAQGLDDGSGRCRHCGATLGHDAEGTATHPLDAACPGPEPDPCSTCGRRYEWRAGYFDTAVVELYANGSPKTMGRRWVAPRWAPTCTPESHKLGAPVVQRLDGRGGALTRAGNAAGDYLHRMAQPRRTRKDTDE